ncbi:MAG: DUF697 domain-containing protein [Thermodesulfovibrionales bacterium]|nr:DUF697 domain-containing protein [Thermodesulfovibrionales bacterium]
MSEFNKKIESDCEDHCNVQKQLCLEKTIRQYAFGSAITGLIPFPLIDLVALTGIQLKLISKISEYYGVDFSEEKTKSIIASLTGAAVPIGLTGSICSLFKVIPFIGYTMSMLSMPVFSSASTYAVGKLFVKHFESGGTLLNLDVNKSKSYYDEQVRKGKELADSYFKKGSKNNPRIVIRLLKGN